MRTAQYLFSYRIIMLNEIDFFGILKYVFDIVVKIFKFAISSPDEFLLLLLFNSNNNNYTQWLN